MRLRRTPSPCSHARHVQVKGCRRRTGGSAACSADAGACTSGAAGKFVAAAASDAMPSGGERVVVADDWAAANDPASNSLVDCSQREADDVDDDHDDAHVALVPPPTHDAVVGMERVLVDARLGGGSLPCRVEEPRAIANLGGRRTSVLHLQGRSVEPVDGDLGLAHPAAAKHLFFRGWGMPHATAVSRNPSRSVAAEAEAFGRLAARHHTSVPEVSAAHAVALAAVVAQDAPFARLAVACWGAPRACRESTLRNLPRRACRLTHSDCAEAEDLRLSAQEAEDCKPDARVASVEPTVRSPRRVSSSAACGKPAEDRLLAKWEVASVQAEAGAASVEPTSRNPHRASFSAACGKPAEDRLLAKWEVASVQAEAGAASVEPTSRNPHRASFSAACGKPAEGRLLAKWEAASVQAEARVLSVEPTRRKPHRVVSSAASGKPAEDRLLAKWEVASVQVEAGAASAESNVDGPSMATCLVHRTGGDGSKVVTEEALTARQAAAMRAQDGVDHVLDGVANDRCLLHGVVCGDCSRVPRTFECDTKDGARPARGPSRMLGSWTPTVC